MSEKDVSKRKEIMLGIKRRFGSVKRFCEVNDLSYNSYAKVMEGYPRSSKKVTAVLLNLGFIENISELITEKSCNEVCAVCGSKLIEEKDFSRAHIGEIDLDKSNFEGAEL